MVRTQVQLTEKQYEALKRLSLKENISIAELIRRGVNEILLSAEGMEKEERINRAIAAAGRFRSGVKDLSSNHDIYFTEAISK
ncbi:MAG TPA: ribbon-helix-helix protein, CopG family [Syntrophomonadaceae bacterium]|nr:ribbon-helix-helix protein, CopG family [Syntrophomonadaceae bacterium]